MMPGHDAGCGVPEAILGRSPGPLAQLGERRLDKPEVTGSSPVRPIACLLRIAPHTALQHVLRAHSYSCTDAIPTQASKCVGRAFAECLSGGGTASISFQEAVQLREAWLVLSGTETDEIRRVIEEEWGTPLD
jgi:hypothetical protein